MVFGLLYSYLIHRVRMFTAARSPAVLGGRHRRNILTFRELSAYFALIIAQFMVFVAYQLVIYHFQATSIHIIIVSERC